MDFCPYCQRVPGDDHLNDDLSKGTKDHINYCFACGRLITNNPIKHGDTKRSRLWQNTLAQ